MGDITLLLVLLLLACVLILAVLVVRLQRQLRGPEASSGLLMLQSQLDSLRDQIRSSLEGSRLEIDRRLEETNRVVGQVRQGLGEVDRQVRSVTDAARDLRGLQELLRSPKVRGGLGEYLLADLLAQVLPRAHFSLQYSFPGGERVDAVIRAGERLVPIDAKFPLENYRRLVDAQDDAQRRTARRAFTSDVKRHIDDIAERYIRPGDGTYDFALMYIPAEAVYQGAILQQGEEGLELFDYSVARRVIPVSPQSFYAYLQVIVLGLQGLSIEARAREIMNRLGVIRTRLDRFSDAFETATKHLGNAQRQIEEARRRLDRLDSAVDEIAAEPEAATALELPRAEAPEAGPPSEVRRG